jgi:hypothetical protein
VGRQTADRYFIETEGFDREALELGLAWLVQYATEHGHQTAAIAVGIKKQLERMQPALPPATAQALMKQGEARLSGIRVQAILDRKMPFEFTEGPILAVWKKDATLEKLDDLRPPAICVITWIRGELEDWKAAWGPVDLRSGSEAKPGEVSDPVAFQALVSLTASVNLGTGLSHPSDRSTAINTFRILKANSIPFDPDEVRSFAARNGWNAEDATELRDVARKVLEGRRLRSDNMLRDDVIDFWREGAEKENPEA